MPAYNGVAYLEGKARLGNGGVTIDGQHIDAGKVIVATGSHEYVPPIPGIEDVPYLTSTTAFEMESLPDSMIVIGGGYVGCELAQMFARVGVRVTIVFRSRLLPEGEPEISEALARYFEEDGIAVLRVGGYDRIHTSDDGIVLSVTNDGSATTLTAQRVLLSAGRKANTGGLGLEEAGVALW